MTVVVQGRSAFAKLLRLLADQVEAGDLPWPLSIAPAPHLGPYAVRVFGLDYDLAVGLPGVSAELDPNADIDTKP